jgi:hypothetical protein
VLTGSYLNLALVAMTARMSDEMPMVILLIAVVSAWNAQTITQQKVKLLLLGIEAKHDPIPDGAEG